MLSEEWAEQVRRDGDLDAVGPRFFETEPARVGEDVDALGRNADLQTQARHFEVALDQTLKWSAERS
ncbi:hypothetical protein [Sorangium sp. So ce1024]|uniref:hypothetical protein n=1 Tax=Sorangium sp. So ce1024 TaxID=3133327 RepID=UPI003F105C86